MVSRMSFSCPYALYFMIPIIGVMFTLFHPLLPDFSTSSSAISLIIRNRIGNTDLMPNHGHSDPKYHIQLFSRDPLIVYIRNFVSGDEITHLLQVRYEFRCKSLSVGMDQTVNLLITSAKTNMNVPRSTAAMMEIESMIRCEFPILHGWTPKIL